MQFSRQEYWRGLLFPPPGDLPELLSRSSLTQVISACALCAKSLESCPTLFNPTDCSPPGSSVHGILQARILEGVPMPFSRGSSRPRDPAHVSYVSCTAGISLPPSPWGSPEGCVMGPQRDAPTRSTRTRIHYCTW